MHTTILPIYVKQSEFWMSQQGQTFIKEFLDLCLANDLFGQRVIIYTDVDFVERLGCEAGCWVRKTLRGGGGRPTAWPCTETKEYLAAVVSEFPKIEGRISIINHRDRLFKINETENTVRFFDNKSEHQYLIGVSRPDDHPCQLKSHFTLNGAYLVELNDEHRILNLRQQDSETKIEKSVIRNSYWKIWWNGLAPDEWEVCFERNVLWKDNLILQIVPYNDVGFEFDLASEIFISESVDSKYVKIESLDNIKGCFLSVKSLSPSGMYNLVEIFTAEKAPWHLGEVSSSKIFDSNNNEITGRQSFPEIYVYNNVFSSFNVSAIRRNVDMNPTPIVMDSCLIEDEIDYIRFLARTTQKTC